jgi:hypothetical protein
MVTWLCFSFSAGSYAGNLSAAAARSFSKLASVTFRQLLISQRLFIADPMSYTIGIRIGSNAAVAATTDQVLNAADREIRFGRSKNGKRNAGKEKLKKACV